MTIGFDYLNDFNVLMCFFMVFSRSRGRELLLYEFIVIFHPEGKPISPHLQCCSAFAVEGPQLHALRLASAATSARE
jgi:hypothetical protein